MTRVPFLSFSDFQRRCGLEMNQHPNQALLVLLFTTNAKSLQPLGGVFEELCRLFIQRQRLIPDQAVFAATLQNWQTLLCWPTIGPQDDYTRLESLLVKAREHLMTEPLAGGWASNYPRPNYCLGAAYTTTGTYPPPMLASFQAAVRIATQNALRQESRVAASVVDPSQIRLTGLFLSKSLREIVDQQWLAYQEIRFSRRLIFDQESGCLPNCRYVIVDQWSLEAILTKYPGRKFIEIKKGDKTLVTPKGRLPSLLGTITYNPNDGHNLFRLAEALIMEDLDLLLSKHDESPNHTVLELPRGVITA